MSGSRPRMDARGFIRSSTRARPRLPDRDYPFFLTTGRVLAHYQSGTQTRRVDELDAAEPEPFVEIHPDTAREPRHRARRHRAADHAARRGCDEGAADAATSGWIRFSCRSTGAAPAAPTR